MSNPGTSERVVRELLSLITTESVHKGGCFSEKNHSHSLVLLLFQEVCLRHFSCLVGRMMCLREFFGTQNSFELKEH